MLRKEIRSLKAELAQRRAALEIGWSELEAAAEPVHRAEAAIAATLSAAHKERLGQLERERQREEDEAQRLEAANAALQAGAALDIRSFSELLRLPFDGSSGALATGFVRLDQLHENKRSSHESLTQN